MRNNTIKKFVTALLTLFVSQSVFAKDIGGFEYQVILPENLKLENESRGTFDLNTNLASHRMIYSRLADNEVVSQTSQNDMVSGQVNLGKTFEAPILTENKLHQYLGLASLAFGLMTSFSEGEDDDEEEGEKSEGGYHESMAYAATAFGVAAVTSGFITHWDDFDFSEYSMTDPDNIHMALGLLGTLGFLAAVSEAPGSSHPTAGIAGLVGMAIAVKITW